MRQGTRDKQTKQKQKDSWWPLKQMLTELVWKGCVWGWPEVQPRSFCSIQESGPWRKRYWGRRNQCPKILPAWKESEGWRGRWRDPPFHNAEGRNLWLYFKASENEDTKWLSSFHKVASDRIRICIKVCFFKACVLKALSTNQGCWIQLLIPGTWWKENAFGHLKISRSSVTESWLTEFLFFIANWKPAA